MFAVMTFDRDPMQLQDVPAGLLSWIQVAGGWAAFAALVWLLVVYVQMNSQERARIASWKRSLFLVAGATSLLGYLLAVPGLVAALSGKSTSTLEKTYTLGMTVGGGAALAVVLLPFVVALTTLRFRRIWALAKLSFKEAIRNRALYGFSALLLVFLFGSWFISGKAENQVRSYVTVVYWVMKILLLVTAIILAAFSIPKDIRLQTIHTITTKPVERFEIILGRFLGFLGLMTLVLLLMTSLSLVYVLRGINLEAEEESLKAREPLYGQLHFENTGDKEKGTNVGREWDYRSYISAPMPNSNQEPQVAVWDFSGVPAKLADRDSVRCEFAFDIYRTTKGHENRGVSCIFEFHTGNFTDNQKDKYNVDRSRWMDKKNHFSAQDIDDWLSAYRARLSARSKPPSAAVINTLVEKKRARLTAEADKGDSSSYRLSNAAIDSELAEEHGYYIEPAKNITDYHTLYIEVPAGLFRNALEAPSATTPSVQTRVSVSKQSVTQYVGMAKYDLYWRLDDPRHSSEKVAFALNFFKGAFGLWLRLCLVIGLAVALSTMLSGVISLLAAAFIYLTGGTISYIQSLALGTAPGGGPMEALVRLSYRQVALVPLEESTAAKVAANTDVFFRWFLRLVLNLIPDVDRYDLTSYVGEGFNIPLAQLLIDFGTLSLYLLPWIILAYYLFKRREIAAPT